MSDLPETLTPEIKAEWLDALRHGNYQQGRGALCFGASYCCLGVLLDTIGAQGIESGPLKDEDGDVDDSQPGEEGPQWAYNHLRKMLGGEAVRHLSQENDDGATFERLAKWIEEKL